MTMTAQEKEDAVRAFWTEHQGRHRPTEGARIIADRTGIPVNTVRGIQNRIFTADARPWDLPVREPVHTCPACGTAAYDRDGLIRDFGIRRVWRGKTGARVQVESHQSFCRTCRNARRWKKTTTEAP